MTPQASEAKRELYQKQAQIEELQREVLELRRGQEEGVGPADMERAQEELQARDEELESMRVSAAKSSLFSSRVSKDCSQ